MQCPKCAAAMKERVVGTIHGDVTIDQCTKCKGFWFDTGEAEKLKDRWRPEFIDSGDPEVGKQHNEIREVDCPRCGKRMERVSDPKQRHIQLETCSEHGVFMDAGEFTDYRYETLMDLFRDAVSYIRGD